MEISETVLEGDRPTDSQIPHNLYRIATLQERFASFIVDLVINVYLIAGWALLLSYWLQEKPLAFKGSMQILFISTSLAIHFLYFLFFEGVVTATPGKLLGGLIVHKRGGGTPSLWAIFIRNLFRCIDYPLFFLTGLGLMEMTSKCRRLGDLLAGTVVLRKMPFQETSLTRDETTPAGATLRVLAFLLDLVPILVFSYGLLLVIPADRALVSHIAVPTVPFLVLVYFSLSESLFRTSFGKVLFGFKVVQENGEPASFATILLRNLFRPFDLNPIGYFCALLSSRKQRPGDIAAGTLVVRSHRKLRNWLAIPYLLLLAGAVGYLGWIHPDSFYRKGYLLTIGDRAVHPIPLSLQRYWFQSLQLERLELAFNETQVNEERRFDRGDVIFILFRVSGFMTKNNRSWLQADLKITDARKNVVLDRVNVVNSSIPLGVKKYTDLATRFALHPQALPGRYQMELTLRDRFAKTAIRQVISFQVK